MKNISTTLFLIALLTTTAGAQIGVEGGLNMSNMSIKSGDTKQKTGYKAGGTFGLIADMKMEEHVYFEPGLFFQTAGCTIKSTPAGEYAINTITIPLNIEYKSGEKCANRWILGVGPYICKNLSGTYSLDAYGPVPSVSGDLKIGTDIKSLDFGIGLNVGYQTKRHLFLRLRYQQGLANLNASGDSKNSIKTSAIGVTLGYSFGGCRTGQNSVYGRSNGHWRGIKKGRNSWKVRNYHQAWLK